MNPKVSLVVPCYNGSLFIESFMQSVFCIKYDNIQLIVTDDGSSDDSYAKLKLYEDTLREIGIDYILLHKENGGQPSAFNLGIQYATGKYVAWPDIDDRMHPDFIEKKVKYMEEHSEVDFLLSKSAIVPLSDKNKILGYTWPDRITDNSILIDRALHNYKCWFEPGAYFARLDSMDKFIVGRHIYDDCGCWTGSQFQIVFPFFYKGNIGYLDECLYDYFIHDKQHHVQVKEKFDLIRKNEETKKGIIATIKSLEAPNEFSMLQIIEERIVRSETIQAFSINDKEWFFTNYNKLNKSAITKKDKIRYYMMKYSCLYYLYMLYQRIKKNPLG